MVTYHNQILSFNFVRFVSSYTLFAVQEILEVVVLWINMGFLDPTKFQILKDTKYSSLSPTFAHRWLCLEVRMVNRLYSKNLLM